MRIGTSYKQHRDLSEQWDAIVIGSGIGGLTAAAALAKVAKKRVLVLERHYTAGGFTHTFRRPGYEWDVGVHYIGEVSDPESDVRRIFDFVTDGQLEWADMGEVYDRVVLPDRSYDFVKGRDAFREKMQEYFPKERRAIDLYIDRIEKTAKKANLFFAEKGVPGPISTLFGGLMRRPLLKEARHTTREVLEDRTSDQELIGVLTAQWGDYGLPPAQSSFFIHALIANHYIEGAAYPVGGASRIAATMLPVIENAGGEVITNAEVDEILIDDGKAVGVKLTDGHELWAPFVISDAGARNTIERLLPVETAQARGLRSKLDGVQPSSAHLSLYVGLDATDSELGLGKTNLWVYPTLQHDQNMQRFSDDRSAPLPFVYLSFPSAKDPEFEQRHPGHATIEAVTMIPYDGFEPWEQTGWKKRGADYDALKSDFKERLLETLYEQCPSARGRVEVAELSTPLSTRNFANHQRGEIYGLTSTPARFEQRWLRPRTPIKGLFLTGADVASLGVTGALMGGILCSSAVLLRDVRRTAMRSPDRHRR